MYSPASSCSSEAWLEKPALLMAPVKSLGLVRLYLRLGRLRLLAIILLLAANILINY